MTDVSEVAIDRFGPCVDPAPAGGPRRRAGTVERHPELELGVLGALEVRHVDRPVPIRRGLPRTLLCSLVLHRGRPVPAETLIDHLWGERLPLDPRNALQTQMAYLRRALGGTGIAPIVTTPRGYLLELGALDVDVDRFETALAESRRLVGVGTLNALTDANLTFDRALSLWRGEPYTDADGAPFAEAEIVRLRELRLSALEERSEVLLSLGRASEAVAELSALVTAQPLRERSQELLVTALYRTGRQADALRAYERARLTLAEELGIAPGSTMRDLERQVLAHDPRLDWSPPPVTAIALHSDVAEPVAPAEPPVVPGPAEPGAEPWSSCELIGRDQELRRVLDLLSERRLVTLTGPGGAGKTRLAQAVLAFRTTRRTHFVDLAPVESEAAVGVAIAASLGAQVATEADAPAAIVAALGDDGCLLVLDTCERVLAGVGPIVEEVLRAGQGITVLATSRRPLGLGSELAWPVPPLEVPTVGRDPQCSAAFELFVERARRVAPDFVVGDADVAAIAEVCRSLDGLPLAIELAAAQMDALSPAAILAQLAERRSFVARAGGPDRHRTLSAAMDWSVGLLDEHERDMLYRLAVFAPTFDLDAAATVAAPGAPDAVNRFLTLLRSSLVARAGDDRFRLLDTVRAYLLSTHGTDDSDDSGDTDRTADPVRQLAETRCRHAEHYAALAARAFHEIRTPRQAAWLRRLDHDRANLRLALDWCFGPDGDEQLGARLAGDIAWVWTLQGNLVDSQAALERASSVRAEPVVRARVLLGMGLLAAPLGDHERTRTACTESAELGRSIGDDATVAAAYLTLGVAQWASGDLDGAAATHDEAIAIFDGLHDLWGATICRVLRARTAQDSGDLDLAEGLLDVAVDDAKQTGDAHVIGLAYEQYTRLSLSRGRLDRAALTAEASLASNEALGYAEGICAALTVLARVRLAQGRFACARESVMQALARASDIGHLGGMCAAIETIAEVDARTGESERAARLLLVAARARARRGLPLPPPEQHRVGELMEQLRLELGSEWDEVAEDLPLLSLTELVRTMLEESSTGDRLVERDSDDRARGIPQPAV